MYRFWILAKADFGAKTCGHTNWLIWLFFSGCTCYVVGMYLRATKRRNKDGSTVCYYALAENVRHPEKGYVEAKVVHSFGRADQLDKAALERLIHSIRRILDDTGTTPSPDAPARIGEIDIEDSFGSRRCPCRQSHVGEAWYWRCDPKVRAEKKLKAPHEAALLAMAAQRLDRPGSKLACHERWLDRVWLPEAKDLGLYQLYRAMDILAEHGDAIEEEVFWNSADLFKLDVDLIFYDATTAWFETDDEDVSSYTWKGLKFEPLRKRGHSKEGRDNDPQVIIALAVTREGIPVRSWIFPGNTSDVTTVAKIKDDLRGMKLGRTLFVGDAGMYSAANLKELSKGAGRYILATPVGKIKEIKDEVLSHPGRYADIAPNLRAKEVIIGDGERRRRYILCLNEDEADRQKWRRAEILKTLEATLKSLKKDHPKAACHLVSSKRYGRYLSLDDKGRPYLDRDKIKRAEHLDGKFVLTTNDDTLSVADIALGYKGMWIIESCFRKMKTTGLEVRPMFHWMPQRITAHVKLCVLSLMIQRAAELATELPWNRITTILAPLKAVQYRSNGKTIVQAAKIRPETAEIFKKLAISKPKAILAVD